MRSLPQAHAHSTHVPHRSQARTRTSLRSSSLLASSAAASASACAAASSCFARNTCSRARRVVSCPCVHSDARTCRFTHENGRARTHTRTHARPPAHTHTHTHLLTPQLHPHAETSTVELHAAARVAHSHQRGVGRVHEWEVVDAEVCQLPAYASWANICRGVGTQFERLQSRQAGHLACAAIIEPW